MSVETSSTRELLALIAGEAFAERCHHQSLVELFGYVRGACSVDAGMVCDASASYLPRDIHPALAAAKELMVRCMAHRLSTENGLIMDNPKVAQMFLTGRLSHLEHEVFSVLFLNQAHRVLSFDIMFRGTVNACRVERREVAKMALRHEASAVILAHNHPSASLIPSAEDIAFTRSLTETLGTVDVRVLDHIIVAGNLTVSMREAGLI